MHEFNQGAPTIELLSSESNVGIFMLQEHWLTLMSLGTFEKHFFSYFAFGSSAMVCCVANRMVVLRLLLIKTYVKNTTTVHCDERLVVVKVFNYLFINVYFPCSGTANRLIIYENLLSDIEVWCDRYNDCECVIAADFNCDLDGTDAVSMIVQNFIQNDLFVRCDDKFPNQKVSTYMNQALRQQSRIAHILSSMNVVSSFVVMDPSIDFSDHLPLMAELFVNDCPVTTPSCDKAKNSRCDENMQWQMCWNNAYKNGYYHYTNIYLSPLVYVIDNMLQTSSINVLLDVTSCIDQTYNTVVSILKSASNMFNI